MKLRDYFSKSFGTSDRNEIDTLRTHYYHGRIEAVTEVLCNVLKSNKALVRSNDIERHELTFDASDYQGSAILTAVSFTEIAVDFQVLTFNILPTAKGKKVIEKLYACLDKELELKKVGN